MKKKVLVTYNMFRSGYAELVEKYDVTFPPEQNLLLMKRFYE